MKTKTLMKNFVRVLAVIGGVVVLAAIIGGIAAWWSKGRVPGNTILEADFGGELVEYVPDEPVAQLLSGKKPRMLGVLEALEKAGADKRVVGLVARFGGEGIGFAQAQELRDAITAFRGRGKFAVAYADTLGEGTPAMSAYYLATAFDEIYLQPSGELGLAGMIVERSFLRGTLEKLGFTARLDHRKEYKSAKNILTEDKFTDAHREVTEAIMRSRFGQVVQGIARARNLSEDETRSLIDRGPFAAEDALKAGLVDGLAYRDDLYDNLKNKAGKGAKYLYLAKYRDRAGSPYDKGETIALIYGVGGVKRGKSGFDPIFQDITMGADTVAAAFRAAVDDKKVKAILFRIDSPGGSYVASDTIWRETVRARKAGKPVIVSMGNVAGSGGYFVAMSADKIVAQPATLTGSIGVVSGKFITTNFWDKLGISWDEVHTSANAKIWTGLSDYDAESWAWLQQELDRIYEDFATKVADGRRIAKEEVLKIAKGRVWTGEQAKALGLVDELGGFATALKLVREAAGISPDAPIRLKAFPEKKRLLKKLLEEGPDSSESAAVETLAQLAELVRPVARLVREAGLIGDAGVLQMPDPGLAE